MSMSMSMSMSMNYNEHSTSNPTGRNSLPPGTTTPTTQGSSAPSPTPIASKSPINTLSPSDAQHLGSSSTPSQAPTTLLQSATSEIPCTSLPSSSITFQLEVDTAVGVVNFINGLQEQLKRSLGSSYPFCSFNRRLQSERILSQQSFYLGNNVSVTEDNSSTFDSAHRSLPLISV